MQTHTIPINHLLVYSVVGMEAKKQKEREKEDIIYFVFCKQKHFFNKKIPKNNRSSLRKESQDFFAFIELIRTVSKALDYHRVNDHHLRHPLQDT